MGERTLEMTTAVNEGDVDVVLLHPEETKNTVRIRSQKMNDYWINGNIFKKNYYNPYLGMQ